MIVSPETDSPACSACRSSRHTRWRILCRSIVQSRIFEYSILLIIIASCIGLALYTPFPNGDSNKVNAILEQMEIYCIAVFALECILKISAYGFIWSSGTYFRSGMNILDFVIVVIGLIGVIAPYMSTSGRGSGHLDAKSLRAFRVLRPLRVLSGVGSLQVELNSIVRAMVPLLHVALLVLLLVMTYAIIGVELFMGALQQTCFVNQSGSLSIVKEPMPCGSAEGICSEARNEVCHRDWAGPNDGITSFDNFGLAMLTVFQCLTMEGWTSVLYWMNDALGSDWPWIYFVSLIIIGSFLVMNLILGVLSGMFSKERAKADRTGNFRATLAKQACESEMKGYLEWIAVGEGLMKRPTKRCGWSCQRKSERPAVRFSDTETCRIIQKWRMKGEHIAKSQTFYWLVIVTVFLNTLVLATEHASEPEWLNEFQEMSNPSVVSLFALEMLFRLLCFGPQRYFRSLFNRLDCFLVVVSIIDCALVYAGIMPEYGLSALRTARLMRIFKVTNHWLGLRNLSLTLFGGRFNIHMEDQPVRQNFDSFWQSLLTVFQILTGEDWHLVMYRGIQCYGGIRSSGAFVAIYFIAVIIGGKCVLLNVFLAIAVDNLGEMDEAPVSEAIDEDDIDAPKFHDEHPLKRSHVNEGFILEEMVEMEQLKLQPALKDESMGKDSSGSHRNVCKMVAESPHSMEKSLSQTLVSLGDMESLHGGGSLASSLESTSGRGLFFANVKKRPPWHCKPTPSDPIPPSISLFLFSPNNEFRVLCHAVCANEMFRGFILLCILVSSGLLAGMDPLRQSQATTDKILDYCDYAFTAVFGVEILMKVVAYGAFLHPGAFCRSYFNVLDGLVVVLSVISYTITGSDFSAVKALRVFRVLRPLIAINRAQGLKRVVQCVIVSIKTIWNIILVTFIVEFIFAVIGVQLFKGRFSRCTDSSMATREDCQGSFFTYVDGHPSPELQERQWIHSDFNFDNLGKALITMFTVSTTEGWLDYAYTAIDSNAEDHGPIFNYRPHVAAFFVAYIIAVGFFMLNIFVGFIIVTFQNEGAQEYTKCQLDKNQSQCLDFALHAKPVRRYIPSNRFQYRVWWMVTSEPFEYCVLGLILLNTVAMACRYYDEPKSYSVALDYLNMIFTALFTVECILKLFAFRLQHFFRDPWNAFDFLIVVGSVVDIIYTACSVGDHKFIHVNFFRIFRALRLGKLLGRGEHTRILLWTFARSLLNLPYVSLLIVVVFFIYAVIGMQVFGKIALDNPDSEITRNNNFRTFGQAILLLFRCATGEAWQDIMMSCSQHPEVLCDIAAGEPSGAVCGSSFTYVYFTTFHFVCTFMILNVLVAVIMDNFDYLTRDWSIVGPQHLDEFVRLWADYDPDARGFIPLTDVIPLLRRMNPPLGIGKMCPRRLCRKKLLAMNMPLNADGTVHFNATLFALVRTSLAIQTEGNIYEANARLRVIVKTLWSDTPERFLNLVIPGAGVDDITVGMYCAASMMQDYYRLYRKRKASQANLPFEEKSFTGKSSI
ncbi:Muscle calcium channel subunit alpha-1 [Hypsibius exemplaris]|uniref:Muscle calcium channel subunit alpha-1 n=1 Tax=Hypsibius exemplaris TaxID=2072580 RepID=A0A1W0WCR4_HYPEX|nr:Muscle calcium channel subunit alpha-1 [Hypsibius exemplaris]